MQGYHNKPMKELAAELCAGLMRLRKGYVDAAEALLKIIDPLQDYPYDFIVYRLTGFRGSLKADIPPISGSTLRQDLVKIMLDVSDSFDLTPDKYNESVRDIDSLAIKLKISVKTIQRWRKLGLPGRKFTFPDGKKRIGFLQSSIDWFVRDRQQHVLRSIRFSQMTAPERQDIIRRAYRMANFTRCSLMEVAKRLSLRTGRAVETIRYTIRKHDREHPEKAIFPLLSAPLVRDQKEIIYRCFLGGVTVPTLAKNYRRTRGSIYRIINEMRASQLLQRSIEYIHNPEFDLPNADELILGSASRQSTPDAEAGIRRGKNLTAVAAVPAPQDLPPYLRSLYDVPLLDAKREHELFRKFNYLKYKADQLRRKINVNRIRAAQLKAIEMLLLQSSVIKNEIIRANLRLVVSIAKKHLGGPMTLFELISDGNVSLMKAVEKFDFSRGNRFSTYASWAIMRNFARSVPQERYQLDRFETGNEDILDIAGALKSYDPNEVNLSELRESIDVVLAQLSPRERTIVMEHYGLNQNQPPKTLDQLGKHLGLSKERVRQIEIQALGKLREILNPQQGV